MSSQEKAIDLRLEQSLKASQYITFTLLGIVISFKFLQASNVLVSILVTPSGIFIFSRLSHPLKASSLILFTQLAMTIDLSPLQCENALLPIDVTSSGMSIDDNE